MINETKNGNGRLNGHSKFSSIGNFGNAGTLGREIEINRFDYLIPEAARTKNFLSNYILASQADCDFARLMPYLETVTLARDEQLHSSGERCRYIYFPETAVVSNLYTLCDGSTIEVAMIGREGASELDAAFGSQPPAHWTKVAVGGTALRIKTAIFKQEFTRGGKLQTLFLDYLNFHIAQISQRVACKSFHTIETRFCTWLLMLHDRVRKNQIAMTQEQIALFLGVHRPSVTLVAQILREKNLIDYTRGKISILDRQNLEASACECYSVIKRNLLSTV